MNPAIIRLYNRYISRAQKAEELKVTLEKVYESDDLESNLKRAILDKVIDYDEADLLREFYSI